MESYETMTEDFMILTPPTEEKRRKNEITEGASEKLTEGLTTIFGRFPSMT